MDDKKKQSIIIKKIESERILRLGDIIEWPGRLAKYKVYFNQDNIVKREYYCNPRNRRIEHFLFSLEECSADYFEKNVIDEYVSLKSYCCYTIYATSHIAAGEFSFTTITHNHIQKNKEFLPKICSSECCAWGDDDIVAVAPKEGVSYYKCRSYSQYMRNVLFLNYLYITKKYNIMHLFLESSGIECSYMNTLSRERTLTNRQTVDVHKCLLNQVEVFRRANSSKIIILKTKTERDK